MTPVCRLEEIHCDSGVTALVAGRAVAVFRTGGDDVYALSNYDPFGRASVLGRGIVGTGTVTVDGHAEEVPFVASPLHKQRFDLRTGDCLDDPKVHVATYEVQVSEGMVLVGDRRERLAP